MTMTNRASVRPPLFLIDTEADTLTNLALAGQDRSPLASDLLLDEISRAEVVPHCAIKRDVVTMQSFVEFSDEGSGRIRRVQLVYPADADVAQGRISVLTPIGAGLIGLSANDVIDWPDVSGQTRSLRIISVLQPPSAH